MKSYIRDSGQNDWLLKGRLDYLYDSNENLIETISSTLNGTINGWVPSWLNVYSYDVEGFQNEQTRYKWNANLNDWEIKYNYCR